LNSRPLQCDCSALPTELPPRETVILRVGAPSGQGHYRFYNDPKNQPEVRGTTLAFRLALFNSASVGVETFHNVTFRAIGDAGRHPVPDLGRGCGRCRLRRVPGSVWFSPTRTCGAAGGQGSLPALEGV